MGGHLSVVATPGSTDPARLASKNGDANIRRKVVFRFNPGCMDEHCCPLSKIDLFHGVHTCRNVSPRGLPSFNPRGDEETLIGVNNFPNSVL